MTILQLVLGAICLVTAVWLVVLIVLDRLPGDLLYGVLAVIEVGLVVQLVIGLVRVFGDHGGLNVAAYVGYLVGSLLVLPVAFAWSVKSEHQVWPASSSRCESAAVTAPA